MASSNTQKKCYDKHSYSRKFGVNDYVWLSIPVAGKLDPKWEGGWKVTIGCTRCWSLLMWTALFLLPSEIVTFTGLFILVESDQHVADSLPFEQWTPPEVEHFIEETSTGPRRSPPRTRRPPDYYCPWACGQAHTKWGNRLISKCVIINYVIGFVRMVALIRILGCCCILIGSARVTVVLWLVWFTGLTLILQAIPWRIFWCKSSN